MVVVILAAAAETVNYTELNPPPAPERDLWWAAQRIAAPDTADYAARHRRGFVRLPYDLGPNSGGMVGDLVEAWVCCDPACGGVELGEYVLEMNHDCCPPLGIGRRPSRGRVPTRGCRARRGFYHGPFTAWWEPGGALP